MSKILHRVHNQPRHHPGGPQSADLGRLRSHAPYQGSPPTQGIPVIALTAHAMKEDEQKARNAGCDDYGSGFSVSIDQQIGRISPFLRFSIADSEITDIRRFLSLGAVYRAPLNRQWDALAIGVASGDPSDAAKREEILLEIFWRIQLIPFVAVTPDIHFFFNPSDNPTRARIVVAGIRLQIDF